MRGASPASPRCKVMSCAEATGATLSSTVTVAVQELELPLRSVTVSVTGCSPTSVQSKLLLFSERFEMPQTSLEPLSIAVALMAPLPLALSCTLTSWQEAVGAISSTTVTVAVQVLEFPLKSVAVKVIVCLPTSAQSKIFLSGPIIIMPQASLEPLSMSANESKPLPLASIWTVASWQETVGAILSSTVTVALQVLKLPLTSVAVSVTSCSPTSVQPKLLLFRERPAMPQASKEPLSICSGVMVAWPFSSNWIVISWHLASGVILSSTVTIAEQVLELPFSSVTMRVTVCSPTSLQSKLLSSRLNSAMPQSSKEPLFTWAGVMEPIPCAFSWTVVFWQTAVGGVLSLSSIEIVEIH